MVGGDEVALASRSGAGYVSAGGGDAVRVEAPSDQPWETFIVSVDDDVGAQSTSARAQVLALLQSERGRQTLAGQHDKNNATPADATNQVGSLTGKTPAVWSGDFLFGADVDARQQIINEAIRQWEHGALVELKYYACAPTRDERCAWTDIAGTDDTGTGAQHLTDAQWADLVTDHTPLNDAWLTRLDTLSVFFRQLQAKGVAPLFRPFHQLNKTAFWWSGRRDANGTRKLFQITHDFLVNVKGFKNIIWVWDMLDLPTLNGDLAPYDPGDGYYDIGSLSVRYYDTSYPAGNYALMRAAAGTRPFGIGECGTLPTSAQLAAQPEWAFFMLWPDYISGQSSALQALYAAPNVLTEERLPGWK
jgi:mannan endo-1,4-beta-mannosidase